MNWGAVAGVGGMIGASLGNTFMQWKNLQYQKDLQKKLFGREDNSIWRRVQDLKRAGLSPVLAAGQGASAGPAISTRPPQSDMAEKVMAMIQMKQNIAQSNAQIELAQAQKKLAENTASKVYHEKRYAEHEANFFQDKPYIKNMSQFGKMASEIDSVMNWFKDKLDGDTSKLDNAPKQKNVSPPPGHEKSWSGTRG